MKVHGQCHCGAIAYEAEVEVGTINVCHCLDCQTLTGSAFRSFLRLANLPNFALDRLSRYEATLWRQVGRILFALDALDRRKPQEF